MRNMTTLCYIEKDGRYLMLHRISKKNDVNRDKWIGVGGHFEENESPEDCLIREVMEETGLTLKSFQFHGIVTFCCEGWGAEYMCLYTAEAFESELAECNEGRLEWVDKKELQRLNLWDGDYLFFDLISRREPFFSLKLCYRNGDQWYRAVLNGRELELFDLCTEKGELTGRVKERSMVHRDGDCHLTVHIWVVRHRGDGGFDVLLQKRSLYKEAYPGCYDVSSAGHIGTGEGRKESAVRELEEELGIRADVKDLRYIGMHEGYVEEVFWEEKFKDWELSPMYLYEKKVDEKQLKLQESEVEEAVFTDYEECLKRMEKGSFKHCIYPKEFALLREAMQPDFSPDGVWIRE